MLASVKFNRIVTILFLLIQVSLFAQTKNAYPASFMISRQDFDKILAAKGIEVVDNKNNKYLDGSIITGAPQGNDRTIKVKLAYFKGGQMIIHHVSGQTPVVYITTNDKSAFYNGRLEKDNVVMLKVSEAELKK